MQMYQKTSSKFRADPKWDPIARLVVYLVPKKTEQINTDEKWQGWSGYVYCGKRNKEKRIFCGPDNGYPCRDCYELLFPRQMIEINNDIQTMFN